MVKNLNIKLDNDLYQKVTIQKGKRTWTKFFTDLVNEGPRVSER